MNTFRPSLFRHAALAGCCALLLSLVAVCHGQSQDPSSSLSTTWTRVDQFEVIESFQYPDGVGHIDWGNRVSSPPQANGHVIDNYTNGYGGTATVEYDPTTGQLVLWTITIAGGSAYYKDGAASGHLGSFVWQSNSSVPNSVTSINGTAYAVDETAHVAQTGDLLSSTAITSIYSTDDPNCLWAFTYNGTDCPSSGTTPSVTYDYANRVITRWSGGVTTVSSTSDLRNFIEQIEIGLSDGTVAKYVGGDGMTYLFRPSSTAQNKLTKLNGYAMNISTTSNVVSLPKPLIRSFVWNGNLYAFEVPYWQDNGTTATPRYVLLDAYISQTAFWPVYTTGYNDENFCYALVNPDKSFGGLYLTGSTYSDGSDDNEATLTGGLASFTQTILAGSCTFTSINNCPYTTNVNTLTPVPPVTTFVYNGHTYHYSTTTAGTTAFGTQYTSTDGGGSATMTWSQATNQFVSMIIAPLTGGNAKYVNGDAVGRPGAYVLSSTSTLANALEQVNTTALSQDGDAMLPSGGYTNSNGVFDVKGNFLTLGTWSNAPDHVGFSLSYDDGTPVTIPATIEFTAGRTLTTWLWDAATSDDTGVNYSMQLDQNSRLMLYPPSNSTAAVPTPTVVLDPSSTNPSEFAGVVRFDGPVRISKQGDLSMGEFTQDPFPPKPTQ